MNNPEHGSFVVPAGNGRNFRFDGVLLAVSSSRKPGGHRWIEFALYRSDGGTYVLSRAGYSLLFHRPDCDVVGRNRLRIGPVPAGGAPCELCGPDVSDGVVCPETPRHWAGMFDDVNGVIRSLERDGDSGRYITHVASHLIEAAAVHDKALADAWTSVRID